MGKLTLLLCVFVSVAASAKQDIHVLFLGTTGVGKSSLINIFYNHITGKSYEDVRDYVIPLIDMQTRHEVNVEKYKTYGVKLRASGIGQTNEVREYTAENDDYIVHMWDTSGFNDMNDDEIDESNIQKIVSSIGNRSIHAIAVVFDVHDLNDSSDLQGILYRAQKMFPETASNNIVGIYTRASIFATVCKRMKERFKQEFSWLMKIPHQKTEPDVYLISGSSFFDVDNEEDVEFMRASWANDRSVVDKLLADAVARI